MESARVANHHDLHRIAELWADATAELTAQRGGAALAQAVLPSGSPLDHLRAAQGLPDQVVAAGLIDDVVVGFGCGRLRQAPGERIGVIEAVYVEPEAREVGVGDAIAGLLVEHFDAMGCEGVDAFALPGNRKAKAFFETHGFTTRLLVMHRMNLGRETAGPKSGTPQRREVSGRPPETAARNAGEPASEAGEAPGDRAPARTERAGG